MTQPLVAHGICPPLAFGYALQHGVAEPPRPLPPSLATHLWHGLAQRLIEEPGLHNYSGETLESRWREGRAAVAVAGGEIVSYISLIPLFTQERQQRLNAHACSSSKPPAIELYESATGWTHPKWRSLGVSRFLRRQLLQRDDAPARLYLSATIGLGASRVLPGLGWRLRSWAEFPFVSALIGMPCAQPHAHPHLIPRQPSTLGPYLGMPLTPQQNPDHRWGDYSHLWLSDIELAKALDRQLAGLVDGELTRWRERVATLYCREPPEPGWKPFLFTQHYDASPLPSTQAARATPGRR